MPLPERPPLRPIDKYIKPECPCLSKRYTVAVLTCLGMLNNFTHHSNDDDDTMWWNYFLKLFCSIGFIISFGMRCNMGMAKLQEKHGVSWAVAR